MSGMRLGVWGLVGLGVTALAAACGGGSPGSDKNGMPSNANAAGTGGASNVAGAGGSHAAAGAGAGAGAGGMSVAVAGASAIAGAGGMSVAVGPCTNTMSDPAHCGSCTNACTQGQICDQGACKAPVTTCTAPQIACNGVCADLTSTAHCGNCQTACAAGQSCTAGVCACPGTQAVCNAACVDTQTSTENCGGCNQPCATGQVCAAGKCGCASGQALCGGACVDTNTSQTNCGACGTTCSAGQVCSSGACVSSAGTDGCTGGAALGVTLKEVDAYQTVKVPVMASGAEVTSDKRTTDLVTGRQTMFRVSISVDAGFSARQISARININNGTTPMQYFVKQTVSKSSVETDPTTTFQVYVPPDQITVDTRYSAELVECATGSGQAGSARFPATGDTELGARHNGGLKVTLIPLQANNSLPDTSDTALAVYKSQMMAMYPIDAITFTVGSAVTIDYPVDWETALDTVRAKRKTDNPAADVYYFGMLKPVATFKAFCGMGCTAGIGYVADANTPAYRAAMGVAYADSVSAETMAHEIGHNHGRNHSPCVPPGNSISGVDPNYPFSDGRTGILGFDNRTKAILSDKSTDLMGYCDNIWLSEYTYGGISDRVLAVNGNQSLIVDPAALQTWRVLLVGGSKGARWGIPITQASLGEGAPVSARIFDAAGKFLLETTAYRTQISDTGSASIMVPEPQHGWAAVDVAGSGRIAFAAP